MTLTCLVITIIAVLLTREASAGTFTKIGTNPANTMIQINNVGSGIFSPSKISNWQYDLRWPLIYPPNTGTCNKNIYNANCVNNGDTTWNIYFGGWDGVSSCHDSVSITVTEDVFETFGPHVPMIATGSVIHVNNPSALKVNNSLWMIVTTQLQNNPMLNKPAISLGTTGIDWNPNRGGVPSANINMIGYPGWDAADVNGGNVIIYNSAENRFHLFFIDFKQESQHSVFHAVSTLGNFPNFQFTGIALQQPMRIVNDLKLINGYYFMGLHLNGPQVFYTVSKDLNSPFPPTSVLYSHMDDTDKFIVSTGFVVDSQSQRLMGALYGAGPVSSLDQNKIFGIWLQKRVLFVGNNTVWGLGQASRAYGPNNVFLFTNLPELEGNFYLYDSDYVDENNRGTLLDKSPTVVVRQGDIWEYTP